MRFRERSAPPVLAATRSVALTLFAQRHSPPQLVEEVLEELDLVFLFCLRTATRVPSGASSHAASCGARSRL